VKALEEATRCINAGHKYMDNIFLSREREEMDKEMCTARRAGEMTPPPGHERVKIPNKTSQQKVKHMYYQGGEHSPHFGKFNAVDTFIGNSK